MKTPSDQEYMLLYLLQFETADHQTFQSNMAEAINKHCSVETVCEIWTIHPDDQSNSTDNDLVIDSLTTIN